MKIPLRFLFFLGFVGVLTYGFHLFSQSQEKVRSSTVSDQKVLLPNELLDAGGQEVSIDELKGKYVGLYFSASWCGPCRTFTPKLKKFRDQNEKKL